MDQRVFGALESRSLGYAHWPELSCAIFQPKQESRSLGYAHWPEHVRIAGRGAS